MTTQKKLNPYIMAPRRVAYIDVLGKIWMPSTEAGITYQLDDHALETIGDFTREEVEDYLTAHSGDFQSVIDFHAVCGEIDIPWEKEENEVKFSDLMLGEEG